MSRICKHRHTCTDDCHKCTTKYEHKDCPDLEDAYKMLRGNMEKMSVEEYNRIKNLDYIHPMTGRPNREKIIKKEDILNVIILLNTAKTFEELIALL